VLKLQLPATNMVMDKRLTNEETLVPDFRCEDNEERLQGVKGALEKEGGIQMSVIQ